MQALWRAQWGMLNELPWFVLDRHQDYASIDPDRGIYIC